MPKTPSPPIPAVDSNISANSQSLPSGSLSSASGLGVSLAELSSHAEVSQKLQEHTPNDPLIGQQVGNFKILERIGKGGFGAVYKAEQVFLEQFYAIKMLRVDQVSDAEVVERFRREAQALGQLRHGNIVDLTDFGLLPEHGFYLVMEYLEGANLQQRIKQQEAFPLQRIQHLYKQICEVLYYIHNKGIVHRDLKPGNIFITDDPKRPDLVKLIDFGIAALSASSEITHTGAYLGTAKYVSPEQAQGLRELDARSDLYSLGVILCRLLTGQAPFSNDSVINIIYHQIHTQPPRLQQLAPHIKWHPQLEAFVAKTLAKDPNNRPRDAQHFWQECDAALQAQLSSGLQVNAKTILDFPTNDMFSNEDSKNGSWSSSVRNANKLNSGDSFAAAQLSFSDDETSLSQDAIFLRKPPLWKRWSLWAAIATIGIIAFFALSGPSTPTPNKQASRPLPPAPVELTIVTNPPRARLYRFAKSGQKAYLGVTPHVIKGSSGSSFTIQLSLEGYQTKTVRGTFSMAQVQKTYDLEAALVAPRPPPPRIKKRSSPRRRWVRPRRRWRRLRRRRRRPVKRRKVNPIGIADPFGG